MATDPMDADRAPAPDPVASAALAAADESIASVVPPAYPQLPPGYVWAYPPHPPPPPEAPWHAPRWLRVATAVWAAVLLVAAIGYALHGPPTIREQTTIASAQPVVDGAARDIVAAAGTGPVVAVSDFERSGTCKISAARSGVAYQRNVDLYATPGAEYAMLTAIAAGLPASFHPEVGTETELTLYADAGNYVALVGSVPAPGMVEIRVLTGCRAPGGLHTPPAPPAAAPEAVAVAKVLTRLGVTASPRTTASLGCGTGTAGTGTTTGVRTVEADVTAPTGTPVSLATALAGIASGTGTATAVATETTVAYRDGTVDVVARRHGGTITVSGTTRC